MALSKSKAKKAAEDAAAEEEIKCLEEEAAGEGEFPPSIALWYLLLEIPKNWPW